MPPWFQVFYAQYVRQREELRDTIAVMARTTASFAGAQMATEMRATQAQAPAESYFNTDEEDPFTVDPAKFRMMNLNITLLEGGILFHSVFVGMTISITTDGFITLLVAIIFHQFFEGLGLGSRIAAVPYKPKALKPWVLVVAFGITCPIGQVIGLVTRDSYDQGSAFALILVGFFNAFSSGLLIYAALVDRKSFALSHQVPLAWLADSCGGSVGRRLPLGRGPRTHGQEHEDQSLHLRPAWR